MRSGMEPPAQSSVSTACTSPLSFVLNDRVGVVGGVPSLPPLDWVTQTKKLYEPVNLVPVSRSGRALNDAELSSVSTAIASTDCGAVRFWSAEALNSGEPL